MSDLSVAADGSPKADREIVLEKRAPSRLSMAVSTNSVASALTEVPEDDLIASAKRLKTSSPTETNGSMLSINPAYTASFFTRAISLLLKAWKEGSTPLAADVQPALSFVFRKPFPHMVFPDFFRGPIDAVEDELLTQKFNFISTDLMQLSQTKELSHERVTEFADLTATFRNDVRPWVETITNIELLPDVDIRGAKYGFTDRLVCHDDRLASRRVAYVYYLTDPSWSAEDGGSLDLFESSCMNDVIIPGTLEKSIMPIRNSMVLFVVGDDSFHQVSEVLSTKKCRLSLTGWFHAKSAAPSRTVYQAPWNMQHHEIIEAGREEMEVCFLAREDDQFSANRKISLSKDLRKYQGCNVRNTMTDVFYRALVEELRRKDGSLPWTVPPNRNEAGWYKFVDVKSQMWSKNMPKFNLLLRTFLTERFLHSLTEISGLAVSILPFSDVQKGAGPVKGEKKTVGNGASALSERWFAELIQCRLERFEHRSYTLKTYEAVQMDDVIDVFYFMDCDLLEADCGGAVVVVDINEPTDDWEPVISLDGESNGMLIVRRDKDMVLFTEYLNSRWGRRNKARPFYRLWMSFPAEDAPDRSGLPVAKQSPSGSEMEASDDSEGSEESGDSEGSGDSDLPEADEGEAQLSAEDD